MTLPVPSSFPFPRSFRRLTFSVFPFCTIEGWQITWLKERNSRRKPRKRSRAGVYSALSTKMQLSSMLNQLITLSSPSLVTFTLFFFFFFLNSYIYILIYNFYNFNLNIILFIFFNCIINTGDRAGSVFIKLSGCHLKVNFSIC